MVETNPLILIPQNRPRLLAAHHTTNRRVTFMSRVIASVNSETVFARCEFDTHADTCALGQNFVPLYYTGRVCDVSPYNADHYESEKDVPKTADRHTSLLSMKVSGSDLN